jgi:hypothetical protein
VLFSLICVGQREKTNDGALWIHGDRFGSYRRQGEDVFLTGLFPGQSNR